MRVREHLSGEQGLFGPVALDPTVSQLVSRLARDSTKVLAAITPPAPRCGPGPGGWPVSTPGPRHRRRPAVGLGSGRTLVTAHSDKEQAAPTFKRGYDFHPVCAFADHGSEGTGNPGHPAAAGQRRVHRRRPHHGSGSVAAAAVHHPGGRIGRKVLIRAGAADGTHAFLDWLHAQRLAYSVGYTLPEDAATAWPRSIPDPA